MSDMNWILFHIAWGHIMHYSVDRPGVDETCRVDSISVVGTTWPRGYEKKMAIVPSVKLPEPSEAKNE